MKFYTKIEEIERDLNLPKKEIERAKEVEKVYPFLVNSYYFSLAQEKDYSDPIFTQFFPKFEELEEKGENDPFNEECSTEHPHLIRRYKNRLLVLTTNRCFIHCRFCMRKRNWRKSSFFFRDTNFLIKYIKRHPEIEDVILSGGDPFTLPHEIFEEIVLRLKKEAKVKILRIGTRAPVVAPSAITDRKLKILEKAAPVWINTHFNHEREITDESGVCVLKLLKAGCPVNNQSVLLKNVNDTYICLKKLFTKLLSIGVKPYYLFSCDPVKGTTHFFVEIEKGKKIMENLKKECSGMAIPHYAVDSKNGKEIIA